VLVASRLTLQWGRALVAEEMNLTKPELTDVALAMTMPAEKAIQVLMPSVSVCFLLCALSQHAFAFGCYLCFWYYMCVVYGCGASNILCWSWCLPNVCILSRRYG